MVAQTRERKEFPNGRCTYTPSDTLGTCGRVRHIREKKASERLSEGRGNGRENAVVMSVARALLVGVYQRVLRGWPEMWEAL